MNAHLNRTNASVAIPDSRITDTTQRYIANHNADFSTKTEICAKIGGEGGGDMTRTFHSNTSHTAPKPPPLPKLKMSNISCSLSVYSLTSIEIYANLCSICINRSCPANHDARSTSPSIDTFIHNKLTPFDSLRRISLNVDKCWSLITTQYTIIKGTYVRINSFVPRNRSTTCVRITI
uniref:Phlebovirus glycoprotein G2 fusion domain-containing protein n=1 Tax=Ascaris lumbricoides TaxID=6252 RepID=A0A0M3HS96_ASCLU